MEKISTALVTGASRGLGLALARKLADLQWNLIIDARHEQPLLEIREHLSRLTHVVAITGDIADPRHREELARASERMGGLDAVVNNAGILGPSPLPALLDFPLEKLDEVFRVNVAAQLGVLQAVRSQLKPGARILNITSDAAVSAYPGWGGYGAAKAAFEQLTNILAIENPAWRFYTVDPGDMRTQMHQEAFPGEDISDRPAPEESVPGLLALLSGDFPSGRYVARDLVGEAHS